LSRSVADRFPPNGTHLHRYAAVFPGVEINSSFHRHHRPATYAAWAATVPAGFRFSVKVPKAITHEAQLATWEPVLSRFVEEAGALGEKLGCMLVQLPPSLAVDLRNAASFFSALRRSYTGLLACEPRHASWSGVAGDSLFRDHGVARVAADPPRFPDADRPAGHDELVYYRLHGSPRIYHSAYPADYLDRLAADLRRAAARGAEAWCIFDNTASGAAVADALATMERLAGSEQTGSESQSVDGLEGRHDPFSLGFEEGR
jgi:uncharacterized protein YecE (DUF72 family)